MEGHGEMTDYERQRLENIKRNEEMLAALKINSKLSDLSAVAAKFERVQGKSQRRSQLNVPLDPRRSLRTRGVWPDAASAGGLKDDNKLQMKNPNEQGPLAMSYAYSGDDGLGQKFLEIVSGCSRKSILGKVDGNSIDNLVKSENCEIKASKRLRGSVDVEALILKPENIVRLMPESLTSLMFFPTCDMQMVVAGNKFGDVGFWNINGKEDGDGIYLYHPHSAPVSGFVINHFSISKMYSSCYDGLVRLMDVEKEVFDLVYSSEYGIYTISQSPHDVMSLYFGEGRGGINMWDVRAGKSSFSHDLHKDRIYTIDLNSDNENIMATSSSDATACIWDLRQINSDKLAPLNTITHKHAVHSAYFSPTGKFLATTSSDNNVGISRGASYENTSFVHSNNQTGKWLSRFRGIWGWDDSCIYIGNTKRGVNVISAEAARIVATLESDLLSAVPFRLDAHPYNVGMLAGASSTGQVYIWTLS